MKIVDVIRPGSLSQIIGPSGTLKRILKNKSYFEQRGYEINIFTHDSLIESKPNIIPHYKNLTIENKPTSLLIKIKRKIRSYVGNSKLLSILYLKRSEKYIKKLVDFYISTKRTPDIVVFHSTLECYLFMKKNQNQNIKTVCFYHSDGIPLKMEEIYYPKLIGSSYFNKQLRKYLFVAKNVDKNVFIASTGKENFLKYYPVVNEKNTALLINGIEDFTIEEKNYIIEQKKIQFSFKYRLCCVGTINTRKGHKLIIDAVKNLPRQISNQIHITFIGEGPERVSLVKDIEDSKLCNNFEFVGAVDNSEVYKHLAKANIYILMSKNEGLPISIIEAMRAGLPIISTKIAGIPELVNSTNGFLIDPDSSQLVKILSAIETIDWHKLGQNSRQRFLDEFTFDRMKTEYCNILDSIS